jgi:tetratricopeptide (TPR) repeat protein
MDIDPKIDFWNYLKNFLWYQGYWYDYLSISLKLVEILKRTSNHKDIYGQFLYKIGYTYMEQGIFCSAELYTQKALKIFVELDDYLWQGYSLLTLGAIDYRRDALDAALTHFEEVIHITDNYGLTNELFAVGNYLAALWEERGDYAKARFYYERQHRLSETLRDTNPAAGLASYRNHGALEFELGNYDCAYEYYGKAWGIASKTGDFSMLTGLQLKYAQLEQKKGNLESAFSYAIEAQRGFQRLGKFGDLEKVNNFLHDLKKQGK